MFNMSKYGIARFKLDARVHCTRIHVPRVHNQEHAFFVYLHANGNPLHVIHTVARSGLILGNF